jgi:hypothetical protein
MTIRRRSEHALMTELPDGTGVVVHLEKRCYYPLSQSGVVLWRLYDAGAVDDEALVRALLARYRVDDSTARRDVAGFVERLIAEKILEPA